MQGLLTDAVWDAAVPEEVQTLHDPRRRTWLVVKHVTFSAAQVGIERFAIDEVDRATTLTVVQRRTTVTHSCFTPIQYNTTTRWKVLRESTNPRESVFVANTWQHLPHLLFCGPLVPNYFVNNSRFFDRYFHIPLPIVTKHELGLLFSLGT